MSRHSLPISSNVRKLSSDFHQRRSLTPQHQYSSRNSVQSSFTNINLIKSSNRISVITINDQKNNPVMIDAWSNELNTSNISLIVSVKKYRKNLFSCNFSYLRLLLPLICAIAIIGGILCGILFPLLNVYKTTVIETTRTASMNITTNMFISLSSISTTSTSTTTSSSSSSSSSSSATSSSSSTSTTSSTSSSSTSTTSSTSSSSTSTTSSTSSSSTSTTSSTSSSSTSTTSSSSTSSSSSSTSTTSSTSSTSSTTSTTSSSSTSSSSSSRTSTTSTTATTTTTTPIPMLLTYTNETIYPIWNTVAGGNSSISLPGNSMGNYYGSEPPQNIFDQINGTKYTNFGSCNTTVSAVSCGTNTGVYLTLNRGASFLVAIQFRTGNNLPERDPLTITIEGSNQLSSALMLGSSWSLVYNGSTGLNPDPGRYTNGIVNYISNNVISYRSYRLLVTSKRNSSTSAQYDDVTLLGY